MFLFFFFSPPIARSISHTHTHVANDGSVLFRVPLLSLQLFKSGRLLAAISSRPGQSGRADGYILEGPELAFYRKKLRSKKK